MEIVIILVVISVLIAFNALYVAAEFAAVSVRRARLAQTAAEGNAMAGYILGTVENPRRLDTLVAACQIGITVSSLVLGGYGNSQLLALAAPWVSSLDPGTQVIVNSSIAIGVLLTLTITQVIMGELLPKNIALQYPEVVSLITARPMIWSIAAFKPLIAITNGSGAFLMRLVGLSAVAEHAHVHSPDEIRILVEESSAGGVLDEEERRLLVNTLELRNLTARKVMIPRTHMLTADVATPTSDIFHLLAESNYSRLPVYRDTIDTIVGVIHLRDLVEALFLPSAEGESPSTSANVAPVSELMHPVNFVPDTLEVGEVMHLMQRERKNLVIVVDEYGGTAGMITFEDLQEEIIGEFEDEFDVENPPMELRPNRRLRIRGSVQIEHVNEVLDTTFSSENVDTLGGLIFSELSHIPQQGETVEIAGRTLRVDRLNNNAVAYVSLLLTPAETTKVATRLKLIG